MSIRVDGQSLRRIDLKEAQVQTRLELRARGLQEIERGRKSKDEELRTSRCGFEELRQQFIAGLQLEVNPRRAAELAGIRLDAVRQGGEKVAHLQQELRSLEQAKGAHELVVMQLRGAAEKLEASRQLAARGQKVLSDARDDDDREAVAAIRLASGNIDSLVQSLAPTPSVSSFKDTHEARTCPPSTAVKNSENLVGLASFDSPSRSEFSFKVSAERRGEFEVRVVRRGESSLELQVTPDSYGQSRQLWRDQQSLRDELERAGYRVQRLAIGPKSGGR